MKRNALRIASLSLSLRVMRSHLGSSLFIIAGISVSVGVSVAVISIAGQVFSAPIAVEKPENVLAFYEASRTGRQARHSFPSFHRLRTECQSFSAIAAAHRQALTFEAEGTTGSIGSEFVSGDYFSVLGLALHQGRSFSGTGTESPKEVTAVVAQSLADSHFGGTQAIGKKLLLNGYPVIIVGVMARDYEGLVKGASTQVWLPLSAQPMIFPHNDLLSSSTARWLTVFGRLQAGLSQVQALEELRLISSRLVDLGLLEKATVLEASPEAFLWSPLLSELAVVLTVVGAGGLLALAAMMANIALIVVAQTFERKKETAVRLSLGASRPSILLARLKEMSLLSLVGGGLGVVAAHWFSSGLLQLSPLRSASVSGASVLDWKTLAIAVLIAWVTTLISCLPLLAQVSRLSIADALGSCSAATLGTGRQTLRVRKFLVGAQVSFCMALISAGMLLMQSLSNMQQARVGGMPARTLFTRIAPSQELQIPATGQAAYLRVISALKALPQVQSASVMSHIPVGGGARSSTISPRNSTEGRDSNLMVDSLSVGPLFFQTMGLKLLAGRDFNLGDAEGQTAVAAINEALATRFWHGSNALHQELIVPGMDSPIRIVAIVENVKRHSLAEDALPQLYLPFLQNYQPDMVIVAGTRGEAASLAPLIRKEIESAAPGVRFLESVSLQEHLDRQLRPVRVATTTFLVFGGIILLLSLGGLYSIVSLFVTLRWREIGLRLAIGGTRTQAVQSILREAYTVTALSAIMGVGFALIAANLLSHLLYGVRPLDPLTLAFSLFLTVLATVAAAVKPALSAVRIEPGQLLRSP